MKRYDVCELKAKGHYRHVVVLQANALDHLETRVVAPLVPVDPSLSAESLNPEFVVSGRKMMMLTEQLITASTNSLGKTVANLEKHDYPISRALDRLFKGF